MSGDFTKVDKKFDDFLKEKDRFYKSKIDYILSYSNKDGYFNIKIIPSKDNRGIDPREYFEQKLQTGKGKEKLERLLKENNIHSIIF
ncbi:MAG: hypothetical protein ACP5NZ_00355 [Nanobdellota archaeon]